MSDNKRNGSFAGKGYYIALILCAAAIGITSYVYYRNDDQAQEAVIQETYADILVGTMATEDIPVLATQADPKPQAPSEATQPPATEPAQKKPLKVTAPIAGQTIMPYSMEVLSYNQTTRDWRVHDGVDLAAEAGAAVLAAADGEVQSVFEDDAYGTTVVIRHVDGYTTTYSSLSADVAVKAGDVVTMGQAIGLAGDSAIVESELGSHVHFSVTCYDEPMDPAAFLALGQ